MCSKSKHLVYICSCSISVATAALLAALAHQPKIRVKAAVQKVPQIGWRETAEKIKPQMVAGYGELPLSFEANKGQADAAVKFLSRGSGYTLFLTPTEAVLSLQKPQQVPAAEDRFSSVFQPAAGDERPGVLQDGQGRDIASHPSHTAIRMKLAGANPASQIQCLDELPGKSNYFIGKDQKNWRTNIPTYAKLRYAGVYPGIDLVYYGNQRQLEYDFVVKPGAVFDSLLSPTA